MEQMASSEVAAVYQSFSPDKRQKLLALRDLIYQAASESAEAGDVEESLKWGEPSYVARKGSAVRVAWQSKNSECYGLYFNCQSSLVETFRELYPDQLNFDGKRAIVFKVNDEVPVDVIKHCITLALNYHRLKSLPMLGA